MARIRSKETASDLMNRVVHIFANIQKLTTNTMYSDTIMGNAWIAPSPQRVISSCPYRVQLIEYRLIEGQGLGLGT